MINFIILPLVTIWHALEAIYEGLYDNGKKTIAGIIELLHKAAGVVTVAYVTYGLTTHSIDTPLWKLIVGAVAIRFLIFDYIYNAVRKLPLDYRGRTKIYDKITSKVPGHFLFFVKFIVGVLGAAFLLGLGQN